jgi:hypothetical protein
MHNGIKTRQQSRGEITAWFSALAFRREMKGRGHLRDGGRFVGEAMGVHDITGMV